MRFTFRPFCSLVVLLVAAFAVNTLVAQAPVTDTTNTIEDLHCSGCAKKVTTRIQSVAGVGEVRCDVEKKTVTVTPKGRVAPSPLALWEAVEKAGKTPTKLQGPAGTFTSKPKA